MYYEFIWPKEKLIMVISIPMGIPTYPRVPISSTLLHIMSNVVLLIGYQYRYIEHPMLTLLTLRLVPQLGARITRH